VSLKPSYSQVVRDDDGVFAIRLLLATNGDEQATEKKYNGN
jgi:hypothetical protein